jgi:hypothetical protein
MLVSERESLKQMFDDGKSLRDRNDIYLLDIHSALYEDYEARAFKLEFNLSEMNCDPDFDW